MLKSAALNFRMPSEMVDILSQNRGTQQIVGFLWFSFNTTSKGGSPKRRNRALFLSNMLEQILHSHDQITRIADWTLRKRDASSIRNALAVNCPTVGI